MKTRCFRCLQLQTIFSQIFQKFCICSIVKCFNKYKVTNILISTWNCVRKTNLMFITTKFKWMAFKNFLHHCLLTHKLLESHLSHRHNYVYKGYSSNTFYFSHISSNLPSLLLNFFCKCNNNVSIWCVYCSPTSKLFVRDDCFRHSWIFIDLLQVTAHKKMFERPSSYLWG